MLNEQLLDGAGGRWVTYLTRIFVLYIFSALFKSFDTSFSHQIDAFQVRGQFFSLIYVVFGLIVWEVGILLAKFSDSALQHFRLYYRFMAIGLILVVYGALVSIAFGTCYALFDIYFFDGKENWEGIGVLDYNLNAGLLLFFLLILTFNGVNYYHQNWRSAELQAERLKKENIQAQFDALSQQIDPHFFFNCLSVLTNLVYKDPDLSAQFINQLSKLYRYILDNKFENVVPLSTELGFLKSYIFLINIRHQHSVSFSFSLSPHMCQYGYIPPVALQILVENAIKHNRFTKETPLRIQIKEVDNGIAVINNLNRREQVESLGVGLENIKKRYALLCGKAVSTRETGKTFEVYLPIIFSDI